MSIITKPSAILLVRTCFKKLRFRPRKFSILLFFNILYREACIHILLFCPPYAFSRHPKPSP